MEIDWYYFNRSFGWKLNVVGVLVGELRWGDGCSIVDCLISSFGLIDNNLVLNVGFCIILIFLAGGVAIKQALPAKSLPRKPSKIDHYAKKNKIIKNRSMSVGYLAKNISDIVK